jgi:hypothetical protein
MIAVAQTPSVIALTGLVLSACLASVIAFLSLGRDWSAWQHPRRQGFMPMADIRRRGSRSPSSCRRWG